MWNKRYFQTVRFGGFVTPSAVRFFNTFNRYPARSVSRPGADLPLMWIWVDIPLVQVSVPVSIFRWCGFGPISRSLSFPPRCRSSA